MNPRDSLSLVSAENPPLNDAPVACPLSWSAALRTNARAPRGALRASVERWLRFHGWRLIEDLIGEAWLDSLDGEIWILETAIRAQCCREAQRELEPRGWRLTCGTTSRHVDGLWTCAWEVQHRDRAGYWSLAAALRREGLLYPAAVPHGTFCQRQATP